MVTESGIPIRLVAATFGGTLAILPAAAAPLVQMPIMFFLSESVGPDPAFSVKRNSYRSRGAGQTGRLKSREDYGLIHETIQQCPARPLY